MAYLKTRVLVNTNIIGPSLLTWYVMDTWRQQTNIDRADFSGQIRASAVLTTAWFLSRSRVLTGQVHAWLRVLLRLRACVGRSPNHDQVWPNRIQVTSSLHHKFDQTFPLFNCARNVCGWAGRSGFEAAHSCNTIYKARRHILWTGKLCQGFAL